MKAGENPFPEEPGGTRRHPGAPDDIHRRHPEGPDGIRRRRHSEDRTDIRRRYWVDVALLLWLVLR